MTLIYMKVKQDTKLIFIWKVSYLDLFRNRGTKELRHGLLLHKVSGNDWYNSQQLIATSPKSTDIYRYKVVTNAASVYFHKFEHSWQILTYDYQSI